MNNIVFPRELMVETEAEYERVLVENNFYDGEMSHSQMATLIVMIEYKFNRNTDTEVLINRIFDKLQTCHEYYNTDAVSEEYERGIRNCVLTHNIVDVIKMFRENDLLTYGL